MKQTILVTGSLGLIGFEAVKTFLSNGHTVIGIDNDLRAKIFGITTQYKQKSAFLRERYPSYLHYDCDIRDTKTVAKLFSERGKMLDLILHTAAQTSHDWAKKDPELDFSVNAHATLSLLEEYRKHAPSSVFIYTSTNKVYGDRVNSLPLVPTGSRYDLPKNSPHFRGIDESFPIDQSTHSLFGVSKTAADLMVQEYGKYFRLKTGVFRLGVITGEGQSDSIYQGFLTHIIRNALSGKRIEIIGYGGKQVRDLLHAEDLIKAFLLYAAKPKEGEVYNVGGGRGNALSVLEIIRLIEKRTKKKIRIHPAGSARIGDHKWWISDCGKLEHDYGWRPSIGKEAIIDRIITSYTGHGL